MLTKKTAIGIGIGVIAVVLGSYFLVQSLTSNLHVVNDSVVIGKSDVFEFDAQKNFEETLNVTGSSFHVMLKSPGDGLQLDKDFEKEANLHWSSVTDGKHFINVTNTGNSVLHVTGKLEAVESWLVVTSHLIVISSGIIIIGISGAFSIRKPRGF